MSFHNVVTLKDWLNILGNVLICRELDDKIDTTLMSVQ